MAIIHDGDYADNHIDDGAGNEHFPGTNGKPALPCT